MLYPEILKPQFFRDHGKKIVLSFREEDLISDMCVFRFFHQLTIIVTLYRKKDIMLIPHTSNFGIDFIWWLIIVCFRISITLDMDINFQSNRDSDLHGRIFFR